VDDTFLYALASSTGLRTLNLSQTSVTNKGFWHLCQCAPQITSLVADGCTSLHGSVPGLRALSSLSKLSLSGCRHVSAAQAVLSISAATQLTHLNLSWCMGAHHCSGDPARVLAGLPDLRVLLLDHAALPEPAEALRAALSLPHLTHLSMSDFPFPACDEHGLLTSENCLDGNEEQEYLSSDGSETIHASWTGEVIQRISPVPSRLSVNEHPARRMLKAPATGPGAINLTMLTLRSSTVRPSSFCLHRACTGVIHF
jgi:hypothetical protein